MAAECGRPICSETWPGNATDVKSLLPIVTRLRDRFGIGHMCVVADRGMISADTIAELESRGIDDILGARERGTNEGREIVLADRKPMVPLTIPRARGRETDIEVEEVTVGDWGPGTKPRRYVVCFNPAQARRDAAAREAILASLRTKLQSGDKALVGNDGYRRFLATPRNGHFDIDAERVAEDARFDGLHVLRTNSKLPTLSVALETVRAAGAGTWLLRRRVQSGGSGAAAAGATGARRPAATNRAAAAAAAAARRGSNTAPSPRTPAA